ncbi:hypothetical protein G6F70_009168 [Rhizopus microsporus]|nr:hypothetical protein G6F71_009117 [Rhizopus microsporus]KAG1192749.1 hypothetical protein G6F70_009168 [Rhizopus microsporus]
MLQYDNTSPSFQTFRRASQLRHKSFSDFVVPKRHKFLPTIPVRNKQRGPRLNPVTLKALKNKIRFGSRSFPSGMNAVRATKTLAQLSKPS